MFVKYTLRTETEAASFLSIMSDGSIDTDVIEKELSYVCLCKRGKVWVHFVRIQALERASPMP